MKNIPIHEYDPVVYPRKLFIVKGNVTDEWLNDNFDVVGNQEERLTTSDDNIASVYNNIVENKIDSKYGVLVLLGGKVDTSVIAHESSHAAMVLFNDIGIYVDVDNQEPYAYMVGWIARCIDEISKMK